jgi:ketosteroid isomerase-like protein
MSTDAALLDELDAHRQIERLVAEYCHGTDRREVERFMAIWTDDALYALGEPIGDVRGREQIRRVATATLWPASRRTHHWTTNLALRVDAAAGRADGICNALAAGTGQDGRRYTATVTYEDRFTRDDAGAPWLMAQRLVTIHELLVPGLVAAPA